MKLPDSVRRAVRTFFQSFVGVVALQLAAVSLQIAQGSWVPDVDWLQRVGISASVAGAVALVTFIQNALEDRGTIPSVGKATASSGANPITHDPAV